MEEKRNLGFLRIRQLVSRYVAKRWTTDEPPTMAGDFDKERIFRRILRRIDGTESYARKLRLLPLAAAILLAVFTTGLIIYLSKSPDRSDHPDWLIATAGESPLLITLPDSTAVWLNRQTTLRYPELFGKDSRDVVLEGEAYFDVKPNSAHPFRIRTQELITTVLGTSFDIDAYPESKRTEVVVVRGKVAVQPAENQTGKPVELIANQRVIFDAAAKELIKEEYDDAATKIAWINGMLNFQSRSIGELADVLKQRFGIPIVVDSRLMGCTVTADFTGETLEGIMQALTILINGHYERREKTYILTGAGCADQ